MKTTYLYIKQHRKTGLKYFGKTITKDPVKYLGSGQHWTNHLKKHGKDVITLRIWAFTDIEECKRFALKFSVDNQIVKSARWANMINEYGIGGWPAKWPPGSRSGSKNPMFGKTHTAEQKKAQGIRRAAINRARNWYNNGAENCYLPHHPGDGWIKGRIIKPTTAGRKYYNNGTVQKLALEHPGPGWNRGMLPLPQGKGRWPK